MAKVVTVKSQAVYPTEKGVNFYIEDTELAEMRLSGAIIGLEVDNQDYGDTNADSLFASGETVDYISIKATLARKALAEGAVFSKQAIPLIKLFNDTAETIRKQTFIAIGGNLALFNREVFILTVYTAWRAIWDALDTVSQYNFIAYHAIDDVSIDMLTEPEDITIEYMESFNRAIKGTLGYMTDLTQYE